MRPGDAWWSLTLDAGALVGVVVATLHSGHLDDYDCGGTPFPSYL